MEQVTSLRDADGKMSPVPFFLLAAVSKYSGLDKDKLTLPLNMVLTANGIELPFHETIENLWERMKKSADESVEERALILARDMFMRAGLERIHESMETISKAMSNVEGIVVEALQKAGVKAESDFD